MFELKFLLYVFGPVYLLIIILAFCFPFMGENTMRFFIYHLARPTLIAYCFATYYGHGKRACRMRRIFNKIHDDPEFREEFFEKYGKELD